MKKNVIKVVSFSLLLIMFTAVVNHALRWKDSLGIQYFYPMDKNIMDVMIFGSSHAEYSINTAYLWDDYGIAAYSMSEGGQNLGNTYYYMVEALKRQKPKVMAVELTFVAPGWEYAGISDGSIYRNTMNMKYSKNYWDNMNYSIEVAKELASEEETKNLRKNILLQFPVYHTRYDDLTLTDFTIIHPELGRYEGSPRCVPQEIPEAINCTDRSEEGYDAICRREYVDKMIQLCKENDVQLVFWIAPFAVDEEEMKVYNTTADYVAEQGIPFINFSTPELQEEIGFDYATDMIEGNHVNFDGCRKMSTYWGKYLVDHYGIESRKGQSGYEIYDEISNNWHAAEERLREQYRVEMGQ